MAARPASPAKEDGVEDAADDDSSRRLSDENADEYLARPSKSQQVTVLICAFLVTFLILGQNQAYGIFQAYHRENIGGSGGAAMLPDGEAAKRSVVALGGSLGGIGLCLLLGVLLLAPMNWSRTLAWGPLRISSISVMAAVGAAVISVAYICAALSTRLWQLVLTQGVLVGVGGCLVYYPITTMAAEYFEGKRATAIGVWSMGSGLGGLFFSPVLNSLIAAAGILKTYYVLAAVNLAVGLLVALVCPPPRALARPRQRVLSRALWRSPVLHLLAGAGFLNALVAGLPTNFGPDFGRALGFGLTGCAWHLALVNGCGAAARLALGCLGDRWGSRGMQPLASGGAAVAVVALWLPSAWRASGAAWVAFLVAYGGLIAAWGQYQSPVLLEVFGSDVYFAANAVVSFCRGVGTIIGSPVGGAILGNSSRVESARQYTRLAVFTAVILTLNAAFTGVAWYLSRKGRKEEKQEEKCKKTEC